MLVHNPEECKQVSVYCFKKYFLPRIKIENYNTEIDGRSFYDQPINDPIKQYDEVKKFRLIAADLSKQKALYANSRAIQQTIFIGKKKGGAANVRVIIYYILKQSKETILQLSKGKNKSFVISISG